jgi:phenylpyruvate tautomerase PptA (4-oxalocrotonate tautomerase family)
MPTITVTAPSGALEQAPRDRMMKRLSDALLTAEGADIDNAAAQAIAWTYFNEIPAALFYVGGIPADTPRLKIEITTPEGALTDHARRQLAQDIGAIVEAEAGAAGAGLHHWVLFHEVREGGWATAGKIFRRADIVAAVGGARDRAA